MSWGTRGLVCEGHEGEAGPGDAECREALRRARLAASGSGREAKQRAAHASAVDAGEQGPAGANRAEEEQLSAGAEGQQDTVCGISQDVPAASGSAAAAAAGGIPGTTMEQHQAASSSQAQPDAGSPGAAEQGGTWDLPVPEAEVLQALHVLANCSVVVGIHPDQVCTRPGRDRRGPVGWRRGAESCRAWVQRSTLWLVRCCRSGTAQASITQDVRKYEKDCIGGSGPLSSLCVPSLPTCVLVVPVPTARRPLRQQWTLLWPWASRLQWCPAVSTTRSSRWDAGRVGGRKRDVQSSRQ